MNCLRRCPIEGKLTSHGYKIDPMKPALGQQRCLRPGSFYLRLEHQVDEPLFHFRRPDVPCFAMLKASDVVPMLRTSISSGLALRKASASTTPTKAGQFATPPST